jgi:peptidoglycan hydrolase-like protein with peptidoglycan-binding domain
MKRTLITLGVLAVAAGGTFAARAALTPKTNEPATSAGERHTATVERKDLVDRATLEGTLGYADARVLSGSLPGTITGLAAEGSVVDRGGVLYRVNGEAVRLLFGSIPVWRTLGPGVSAGADVKQLEANLKALGYNPGTVDTTWTSSTTSAVKKWQDATGVDETGVLRVGSFVFLPGPRRIGAHVASIGGPAGGQIMSTSATERTVTVNLAARRQQLAKRGARVQVELPTGRVVNGSVADVGRVAQSQDNGQGDPTITVTISIDKGANVDGLDEAPVDVRVATSVSKNVLAVPVSALLARADGGYALEVVDGATTHLVGVETGSYADGYVEVSGSGITEGAKVVTAE